MGVCVCKSQKKNRFDRMYKNCAISKNETEERVVAPFSAGKSSFVCWFRDPRSDPITWQKNQFKKLISFHFTSLPEKSPTHTHAHTHIRTLGSRQKNKFKMEIT